MARSHQDRAAEAEQKANDYQIQKDALTDLKTEVMNADRIGETRLSKLFHEARTTRKGHWKSVHAFITINDGVAEVDHLDKLTDGYWPPETRNRYNAIVSVGVRPFMETDIFKSLVRDDIQRAIDGLKQNEQRYREDAKTHRYMAEERK